MENQLVVFDLANEHYGVDISIVESIIKMQHITTVPHAPRFVEGLTNLRGAVLQVIDLRKRFGLLAKDVSQETRIVIVEVDGTRVGMIVDAVTAVLRVPEGTVEPPPSTVTAVDSTYIAGIAKVDERLVILLDLGKVFSTEEQIARQPLQAEGDTSLVGN
jgi:purine-binding chemotaxis protein CheW